MSIEPACWGASRVTTRSPRCSPSLVCSTGKQHVPLVRRGHSAQRCPSRRGASRETRSCQPYMRWGSTRRCKRPLTPCSPGRTLFAYLDNVHAVCQPERVHVVAGVARVVLQEHAGIEVHLGSGTRVEKTRPAPVRFKGRAGLTSRLAPGRSRPSGAAWLFWAPPLAMPTSSRTFCNRSAPSTSGYY